MIITGLLLFCLAAALVSGEFEAAFRSFGKTLKWSSYLFLNSKFER